MDDQGFLRRVLLYPAHKHDVVVAARLLQGLSYVVVTGDKGYLSRALKAQVAWQGVDLIARHKRNMRPHTRREQYFLRGQRMVESVFSSLDRLGLSERPYRKTQGLVFHLYAVLLGYGFFKLMEHNPAWRLLLAQLGGMWLVAFPNWGKLVGRKHPHQLVGVALSNPQGSHGDGRCGVAAQRLDDVVGLHLRQTQGLILASAL